MDEDVPEQVQLAKFEIREQFLTLLHSLLALDLDVDPPADVDRSEVSLLRRLSEFVDAYQEQSYLLDPYLEELVVPAVEKLKTHVKALVADPSHPISLARVDRLAQLLYNYMKFRGYKTIIRFFPHEIADLSIVLDYLLMPGGPVQEERQWALRYIVLLWLSLICMIPFDLAQFDEDDRSGRTAEIIESVAKTYLGRSGLEREGAALSLSRLYTRKDTSSKFPHFLKWAIEIINNSPDLFLAVGLLHVVCEVTKSGPPELIQAQLPLTLEVGRSVDRIDALINNTVVRKLKTKIIARAALRLLPAKVNFRRRIGRTLLSNDINEDSRGGTEEEDTDVPEEIETALEELFTALQDKDTVVRWSAAKGIARISERLPSDFVGQVLETVMGHFVIHSVAAARIYDLPVTAESTWHGACLACAEMARRGLVSNDQLPTLVDWLFKAIYFDIRKGSHSIGSSVRDAAAYVLWSLARVQDPSSLAPHSLQLARRLVAVSLFDREVHIRRAASAGYQEHVGRTGLFPDGIDVLRKADFYAVGVRRNSFLIAAPQVAKHDSYRLFLIDHLIDVTLRHWDQAMRVLGAQSLKAISQLELPVLGPMIVKRAAVLLSLGDWNDIHGGLTALTELAGAFKDFESLETERQATFKLLASAPFDVIVAPRNDLVLSAACHLIANSISLAEVRLDHDYSVPHWRQVIDSGLKHRNTSVQEAAASALRAVSKLVDCSAVLERLINEFGPGSPIMQQSLGRVIGALDYDAHPHGLRRAVECLLESVDSSSPAFMTNIEARRNCYDSMLSVLTTVSERLEKHLTPTIVRQLINALLNGMTDYTMDERGDVGSWIRMSCIRGLGTFAEVLFPFSRTLSALDEYYPAESYHNAVAGILKQGVERLDNVRQHAGRHFIALLSLPLPEVDDKDRWKIHGEELVKRLFLSDDGKPVGWSDAVWLYPKAVYLLEIPEYRDSVLAGLVLSIGSKTDSTFRPASSSFVDYVRQLPISGPPYGSRDLIGDLVEKLKQSISNNNMFLPLSQTFNVLLQGDALEKLSQDGAAIKSLKTLLALVTSSISRIKNVQRVQESMKVVVGLMTLPPLFKLCSNKLGEFLKHRYPKVRADTAEYLYFVLQSRDLGRDTDEAEEVLLETEWSSTVNEEIVRDASKRFIDLLSVE